MGKYRPRPRKRTNSSRFAENRRAFVDIFGDPFALPESIEGQYQRLKSRGLRDSLGHLGKSKTTKNLASPSPVDFFCDVDKIVKGELSDDEYRRFVDTYLLENEPPSLNQNERNYIEQRLGKMFLKRGVSPVIRYFMTFRKKYIKERRYVRKAGDKSQSGRD
jgi:hypothetical protein